MAEQDQIRVVTPGDRKPGPSTPGMDRQEALATDRMWSGLARTEVGMVSGWHHHGGYDDDLCPNWCVEDGVRAGWLDHR